MYFIVVILFTLLVAVTKISVLLVVSNSAVKLTVPVTVSATSVASSLNTTVALPVLLL